MSHGFTRKYAGQNFWVLICEYLYASVADCWNDQWAIGNWQLTMSTIGNWHSAIGNLLYNQRFPFGSI